MATADINPAVDGIGSNPGILIRAPQYVANGAELVYSSTYLDGVAVKGVDSGQKLMETPWFANGILNNVVLPTLYIEASAPTTQDLIDNLLITIYKRDSSGTEYPTQQLTVPFQDGISDGVGQMPISMEFNRQATQFPWFDIRYEYKFSVSVGRISSGQYLYLEGMYLQYVPNTGVMLFQQEAYGTDSVQAIPIIEGQNWTATSDGSGNITGTFNSDLFDGAGSTTGGQRSLMNAIDAVVTTFGYQTTADTSTVITNGYTVGSDGGYNVTVDIRGLTPTTLYEFHTIILGYITPKAI